MKLLAEGSTRRTIRIGKWALKFARNALGRRGNQFEFKLFRRSAEARQNMLCPALWVSPFGLLLIQAAAEPLCEDNMMSIEEYVAMGSRWSHAADDNEPCPFEPKPSDWGTYGGRLVALDYANHELIDPKP